MKHLKTRLSDLLVEFIANEQYMVERAKDYLVENDACSDVIVQTNQEEIMQEHELTPEFSKGYLEYICLYRDLAEQLPFYERTVFHGAVITHGSDGYLFTGPSGTGKSTHIRLWRKYLGDAVDIVNGDKPILKISADEVRAYGTPWAGKENWQKNCSAPLKGICVLKQAKENKIRRLLPGEALLRLMPQIYRPRTAEAAEAMLALLDTLIISVPVYELSCDISEEAVQVCFEMISGKSYEENKYEN